MSPQLSFLVKVVHGEGDFSSKLVSLVDRKPGTRLCSIEGAILVNERAYTSVQVSEDCNMELKSDLVYCNHSCDPSVVFDTAKLEVRACEKGLRKGDDVTFFYPSTEWDMAQTFQCDCKAAECVGLVQGAQHFDDSLLQRYWLNPHIRRLLGVRAAAKNGERSTSLSTGAQSVAVKA